MLSALTTKPCGYKPNAFAYEVVKGFVTRSESLNKIVSITSHLRKPIVAIAFVNDFFQGGRVELYRLIALYRCILIGQASNSFLRLHFYIYFTDCYFHIIIFYYLNKILYLIIHIYLLLKTIYFFVK